MKAICLGVPSEADHPLFLRLVAETLPAKGYDTVVLLIRYQYEFRSHPEIATQNPLSPRRAREIANMCRRSGIRFIPKMNLFGHQSGKERGTEDGLLRAYPDFDETPDAASVRYCRSLCPRHPQVSGVVRDLISNILDDTGADAFHAGCDEVFEIGLCPRCRGAGNHRLFAEWITTLHEHIVGRCGVEMLIWSDRLLDGAATGYGEWEASMNGTHQAVDMIPKDIICCDWHYGEREDYPSIYFLTARGFRVVVCPWKDPKATESLLACAARNKSERLLGVLQTSWCNPGNVCRSILGAGEPQDDTSRGVAASFETVAQSWP